MNGKFYTQKESTTLKEKLNELIAENNKYAITELYKKFAVFIGMHQESKMIHGDITDENIRINSYGGFYLINAIGENVNPEEDQFITSSANKNFTHPYYSEFRNAVYADDFSLLTIAVSIYAFSIEPSLFSSLHTDNQLLFSKKDFENYKNSRVFEYLESKNNNLLDILLMQIKITLINQCPRVENLGSLLILDEKFHKSFKSLKEKEFLQTNIQIKEEQMDVLHEKYCEQIRKNTNIEVEKEIIKDEQKAAIYNYNQLKQSNHVFTRVFSIICILFLGYYGINSITIKKSVLQPEITNNYQDDNIFYVKNMEQPIYNSSQLNNQMNQNTANVLSNENLIKKSTGFKTTSTPFLNKNNKTNLKKQKYIEKSAKPSKQTVTFKEIDFNS